jgi:hypothetical protein
MSHNLQKAALHALCALVFSACAATHGDVVHPKPGQKNTVEECAKGSSQEQNCSHCASKPGCGFCANPNAGSSNCQPGVTDDNRPSTCGAPLVIGNEACDAPPPPEGE